MTALLERNDTAPRCAARDYIGHDHEGNGCLNAAEWSWQADDSDGPPIDVCGTHYRGLKNAGVGGTFTRIGSQS